jgi:hypothetical protein
MRHDDKSGLDEEFVDKLLIIFCNSVMRGEDENLGVCSAKKPS